MDCLLEKCPDKKARINFMLRSQLVSISTGSECTSVMSGMRGVEIASIDSGPNSEFRFKDIDQEKQRKKLPEAIDPAKLEMAEAIIDSDGQRFSIKRKMTLSSRARGTQGNQKILNAAGIPRPLK